MKHFYHIVVLCLFVLACLFWIDSTTRYRDFTERLEAENAVKDLRIQQLEKDVRILRTDLDVLINGYSEK